EEENENGSDSESSSESEGSESESDSEKDEDKKTWEDRTADPNLYCICRQPDDGKPMICCDLCGEWYHARCLKLSTAKLRALSNQAFVCFKCKGIVFSLLGF